MLLPGSHPWGFLPPLTWAVTCLKAAKAETRPILISPYDTPTVYLLEYLILSYRLLGLYSVFLFRYFFSHCTNLDIFYRPSLKLLLISKATINKKIIKYLK